MIPHYRHHHSGVRIHVCAMALLLWMLLGCSNRTGTATDSYPSVADVSTAQIPVPAHATTILHDEHENPVSDEVTKTTTYTTADSVAAMTTYYQDLFRTLGWKPYGVGPGALDVRPGDLIFGQGGRDGQKPGDAIVLRNVVVSIQPCGNETCVTIKDQLRQMTVPEPFN
jgi:hypothetical protein